MAYKWGDDPPGKACWIENPCWRGSLKLSESPKLDRKKGSSLCHRGIVAIVEL